MLQPDLQQILSQSLSFILLLWILRRFAWRPLLGILDARKARIEEGLRRIDHGKAELEQLKADLQARLAKIDDETRAKIQEAIKEGKRVALEIQEQARQQSQAMVAKANETIELEVAKAKTTLRDDVADMTMQAVERILQQRLDPNTDRKLVESVLEELERGRVHGR